MEIFSSVVNMLWWKTILLKIVVIEPMTSNNSEKIVDRLLWQKVYGSWNNYAARMKWIKRRRGFSSVNGTVTAISMDMAKILDIEPMSILIYEKIKMIPGEYNLIGQLNN